MYKRTYNRVVLFTALMVFEFAVHSQTIDPPYEVGLWKGFCNAAISYTFDDGTSKQFSVAIPIFNELNFDATLFTVTGWSPDWTTLQNAASEGHEIASHTVHHQDLSERSAEYQDNELKDSQNTINSEISGQGCITLAYPFCVPAIDTICSKYYIAARHCQGYIESSTPTDFLNISSVSCGNQGSVKTARHFKNKANNAFASSGWCVYLLHGVDDDGGYSPLSSDTLRKSLEYLDSNKDKFWVSTFGNVVRYIRERNSVSVAELSLKEDSIIVQVTDTLEDAIYNIPVSIRRPLPVNWVSARASQNGQELETKTVEIETERYIIFNAVPDYGDVIIVKSNALAIQEINVNQKEETGLKAWFNHDKLLFIVPGTSSENLNGRLFNIMGVDVSNIFTVDERKQVASIRLSGHKYQPGIYVLCLYN